ncbi:MAG: hypothetical protein ACI9GW_003691 [Halieaceae bacterium]|jgi:hypothetical protein
MQRKYFSIIAVLALLQGCVTSVPPPPSTSETDVSLAYSRLSAVQKGMITTQLELEGLVGEFDRQDDVYGGWLATFELCRYLTNMKTVSTADAVCDDSMRRAELSGDRNATFSTAVQMYFYRGEEASLQQAIRLASTASDRQLLALAQGQYGDVNLPEHAHPLASVRAWQYYWMGKKNADSDLLQVAYDLFAESGNSRGLADVLFTQARQARASGNLAAAESLGLRAIRVLEAIGENEKAGYVRSWLTDELAAR